ncbi:MAG TPA: sterol desaturase family protein [Flavobacteriales bacterium]|nr:sterol desaturase family protein [Flavobacteriales bacterium]
MDYIALSIPVFFLLIGIEILLDKLKKTGFYRFNDAITNLSCGIGQQVTGVFIKTGILLGYIWIYENARLFTVPHTGMGHQTAVIISTWFALFLGVDFFYYWFHRLAHEINVLWGSHIVHHQSEEYNLTVALRQAWVQNAFSWVFYLPLAFLGFEPVMFVIINQFQTLYQFWIHTKHIGKLPPWIEFIFTTPSHHRVHHGVNPKYIDRNHGGTFIIWDRMFGTFQAEEEEVVYGITTQTFSWNPLWVNIQYWIDLVNQVAETPGFADKIKTLLKPPGWKPSQLTGTVELKEVSPETFHKYDTEIPIGLNYYILLQYVFVIIGSSIFLFSIDSISNWVKLSSATIILLAIINLGGLFERKRWSVYLEYLRLIMVPMLLITLFTGHSAFMAISVVSISVFLASLIWLSRYHNIFSVRFNQQTAL